MPTNGIGPTNDQYGDQLAGLIEVGVSDEGLLTHLEWAEVAWIGLSGPVDREHNARVVAALRTLGMPPPFVISGPEGSLL